ncbi:MAG: sulfotransferase [Anaerolineales bacterium]|nr:sulfotransferase [Anaerolineales bacterium]
MVKEPVFSTKPILVTGSHRSGTTWVGKILSTAPRTVYIGEPFNPLHRPGICKAEFPLWYTLVQPKIETSIYEAFSEMLDFRYGLGRELSALRSIKDSVRMLRDAFWFFRARAIGNYRAILKDPIALFSTKWLVSQFDAQALILIRHPAAFVSSLKRVSWKISFQNFLKQPVLMDTYLRPFRAEIERAAANPPDLVTRGALLWKILYSVVDTELSGLSQVRLVRHEDLSLDPVSGFKDIFRWANLPFTDRVARKIQAYSNTGNRGAARGDRVFELKRDSAATINIWKQKLTSEEIKTVFRITSPLLELYYPDMSPEKSIKQGDDS